MKKSHFRLYSISEYETTEDGKVVMTVDGSKDTIREWYRVSCDECEYWLEHIVTTQEQEYESAMED